MVPSGYFAHPAFVLLPSLAAQVLVHVPLDGHALDDAHDARALDDARDERTVRDVHDAPRAALLDVREMSVHRERLQLSRLPGFCPALSPHSSRSTVS